jgi:hypothetical protein
MKLRVVLDVDIALYGTGHDLGSELTSKGDANQGRPRKADAAEIAQLLAKQLCLTSGIAFEGFVINNPRFGLVKAAEVVSAEELPTYAMPSNDI